MNIPKTRVQIFLEADELNLLNRYGVSHSCKTISHVIHKILLEWRRFNTIVQKPVSYTHLRAHET